MGRMIVDGATLEYEVSGAGEPVVMIHGALIAASFRPLLAEPVLTRRYRIITYHRRGYGGSSLGNIPDGGLSIARQAADCRALMDSLGVSRAHIAGHSYGGVIALQLAMDDPQTVHSLTLLEPALMVGSSASSYQDALAQNNQRYRDEGAAVVVDEFLEARFGPGYRTELEAILPGAFDQAVADSPTAFEFELPALLDWRFDVSRLRRITRPVLSVLGGDSEALWPRFGETHRSLLEWLPHAEGFVLPKAAHGLQLQNPRDMARALAAFWEKHPIPA